MSYLFLILQFCLNQVTGATDFYSYTKGTQRCMYINIPLRQTDMPLCLPKPAKNSLVNFQWNLVNHFIYHNDNKIELSMQACSQFIASTHYLTLELSVDNNECTMDNNNYICKHHLGLEQVNWPSSLLPPFSSVGTHDCNPFTEHYTYHLSKANTLLGSLIELWEINLMCSIYMVFSFVNYDTLEWINYVWMCWLWQLCYELWSLYANLKASICKFYCRKN